MIVDLKRKLEKSKKVSVNYILDVYNKLGTSGLGPYLYFNNEKFILENRKARMGYYGETSNILIQTAIKRAGFSNNNEVLEYFYEEIKDISVEDFIKLLQENKIPLSAKINVIDEWGVNQLNYIEYEDDKIILGS